MPETTTSPTKGERSRQAIEEAAYNLFREQGYHATSMRQIAERSGLALGGIYNHFASKEEIFKAIAIDMHPINRIMPLIQFAEGESTETFVRNAARALVDELERDPDFVKLMFIEITEFDGQHVSTIFENLLPQILPIAARFTQMQAEIRPLSAPLLLRAFVGMFFSYYMTEFFVGKLMPPAMQQNALDGFVDIFLHGILKEQP
jgi:AcrR family transcriptional regulator